MMLSVLMVVALFMISVQTKDWNAYCNLNCGKIKNTLCARAPCRPSKACGPAFQMVPMTETLRDEVVALHNNYRQYIAWGNVSESLLSPAANMRALSYCKELEFVAQCWANTCLGGTTHDRCRRTHKFSYVGQNINYFDISSEKDITKNYTGASIETWFDEFFDATDDTMKSFPKKRKNFEDVAHFTQLVWAETAAVGCARTVYGKDELLTVLLVCNYGPGGNVAGQPVYEAGPAASKCPKNAPPNASYEGLCGDVSTVNERFVQPFVMKGTRYSPDAVVVILSTAARLIYQDSSCL